MDSSNFHGTLTAKKWADLPQILDQDGQKVVALEGNGLCLI